MEDEERRRKIEYGRAKLAQYRARKARCEGRSKKNIKKYSNCEHYQHSLNNNDRTYHKSKTDGTPNQVLVQLHELDSVIKEQGNMISLLIAKLQKLSKDIAEMTQTAFHMSEQNQKLQIQFQHACDMFQRSTPSTSTDSLVLIKQQVFDQQQQLDKQNQLLKDYQKNEENFKFQITCLLEKIKVQEMKEENEKTNEVEEKNTITEERKSEEKRGDALQRQIEIGNNKQPFKVLTGQLQRTESDECSCIVENHTQQEHGVNLEYGKENVAGDQAGFLYFCSQAALQNNDIRHESTVSPLPENEECIDAEYPIKGLESPRNILQQEQIELHYGIKRPCFQEKNENFHGLSTHPSVDPHVFKECDEEGTVYYENCVHDHITFITEGIENETGMECLQETDRRIFLAEDQSLHGKINFRDVTLIREQEESLTSSHPWCLPSAVIPQKSWRFPFDFP